MINEDSDGNNDYERGFDVGSDSDEDDETHVRKKPKYIDYQNPSLRSVGQKILDSALSKADSNFASLDELWTVFIQHVRGYEFADLIALQFHEYKDEVVQSIKKDCYDELRKKAYSELADEIEPEVREELRKQMADAVHSELYDEMRDEVKEIVRAELLDDPDLIQEVKDELKRKIIGL